MQIVKTIKEVRAIVKEWRRSGLTVGLVPTMGYLHEGHQSLIAKSAQQNDRTQQKLLFFHVSSPFYKNFCCKAIVRLFT